MTSSCIKVSRAFQIPLSLSFHFKWGKRVTGKKSTKRLFGPSFELLLLLLFEGLKYFTQEDARFLLLNPSFLSLSLSFGFSYLSLSLSFSSISLYFIFSYLSISSGKSLSLSFIFSYLSLFHFLLSLSLSFSFSYHISSGKSLSYPLYLSRLRKSSLSLSSLFFPSLFRRIAHSDALSLYYEPPPPEIDIAHHIFSCFASCFCRHLPIHFHKRCMASNKPGVGSPVAWSASYDDREIVVVKPVNTLPGFPADCALSIQSTVSLGEALVSPLVT